MKNFKNYIEEKSLKVVTNKKVLSKKKGEAAIVAGLVLVVVAVVLGAIYKDQLVTILTTAMATVGDKVTALFK